MKITVKDVIFVTRDMAQINRPTRTIYRVILTLSNGVVIRSARLPREAFERLKKARPF